MAEIDIQEKEGPPAWIWVAVAIGLLLLIGVIWAATQGDDTRDDGTTQPGTVQDTAPVTWDTAPPAGEPGALRDHASGEFIGFTFAQPPAATAAGSGMERSLA